MARSSPVTAVSSAPRSRRSVATVVSSQRTATWSAVNPCSSGVVDRRSGVEQRRDRPWRSPSPDRLVQVARRRPRAVRAEHLDHLGVREVERPPEVVVDEILPGAGVDHEHRARRVLELAGVVEDLVAVESGAVVGRVGAGLEQHPRQLGVAGDPGGAVQGDLEPVAL